MSTAITLAQAEAQLAALMTAQASNTLMVRYGDRSVTYRTSQEITGQINYWIRMINEIKRVNAGGSRHGYSVADFRKRT